MIDKNTKKAAALEYDALTNNAPKLTAKGTGSIAQNIIKIAKEHDIPIKKDEDMINILSQLELNQEIPEELYKAVAELFRFIYQMANK